MPLGCEAVGEEKELFGLIDVWTMPLNFSLKKCLTNYFSWIIWPSKWSISSDVTRTHFLSVLWFSFISDPFSQSLPMWKTPTLSDLYVVLWLVSPSIRESFTFLSSRKSKDSWLTLVMFPFCCGQKREHADWPRLDNILIIGAQRLIIRNGWIQKLRPVCYYQRKEG